MYQSQANIDQKFTLLEAVEESINKKLYASLVYGNNYTSRDLAKAAIETIIHNIYHEAQDTEFDTGFETFRNELKKAIGLNT